MTRTTDKLHNRLSVQTLNRKIAIDMLIRGLLTEDERSAFRPANVSVEQLARLLASTEAKGRNRKISFAHVNRLARDMATHHWQFTGDPIKIDDDGIVRDGQHRLLAIIESNTTQQMAVLTGADLEVQLVTDIGRPRTARDQLTIRGTTNATNAAAAAKLVLRYRSKQIMNSSFIPSITEIVHFVDENPVILEGCTQVQKIRHQVPRAPFSALVAAYVEATGIDITVRDYFFEKLTYGDDLSHGDPILTLRNTLPRFAHMRAASRTRQIGQLYMIVYSWNKYRDDEKVHSLRVPSSLRSETFPTMK
jgi:hypothetical protein